MNSRHVAFLPRRDFVSHLGCSPVCVDGERCSPFSQRNVDRDEGPDSSSRSFVTTTIVTEFLDSRIFSKKEGSRKVPNASGSFTLESYVLFPNVNGDHEFTSIPNHTLFSWSLFVLPFQFSRGQSPEGQSIQLYHLFVLF